MGGLSRYLDKNEIQLHTNKPAYHFYFPKCTDVKNA